MGAFDRDNDMLDRPDLNKCPDCGCFFAQENCPLCGKPCPEEMKAGNRTAPKKQKYKYDNGYRTVMFVDWYHRWWFIALMAFVSPLISIVLLITSPHKRSHKVIAVIAALVLSALYSVAANWILGLIYQTESPVDTSLTKEEYIAACEEVSPEEFYRNPEKYTDKFVKLDLVVTKTVTSADYYEPTCYVCTGANGGDFEIIVYSYLLEHEQNLLPGDKITVYGEGAGTCSVYDNNGAITRTTGVYMAYLTREGVQIKNNTFFWNVLFFSFLILMCFGVKKYDIVYNTVFYEKTKTACYLSTP